MSTKRVFLAIGLVALLVPGLTLAVAQEDVPAKGDFPGLGLTREEAIEGGQLVVDLQAFQDENEPNDTRAQAELWYPAWGEKIEGVIGAVGDVDYFEFGYDVAPGDVVIAAVSAWQFGSNLDSVLTIYDAAGNPLAANDDSWGLDSFLEFTIPPGPGGDDFYVAVRDWGDEHGGADHWYDLYLWVKNPGCEESNNTRGRAMAIEYTDTLECPVIAINGDQDWYKFEGKKDDVAQISVRTTNVQGTLESQVKLYMGSKVLASCPPEYGPDDTNCYLEATLPKTGTYHIQVTDAHNKGGADKRYWLELWFEDQNEPNNVWWEGWRSFWFPGKTVRGHISVGDPDWFWLDADAGDILTFSSSPGIPGELGIEVYDSDGTTLLADNYGYGWPSLNAFSFIVPRTDTYYIHVYPNCCWVDWYPYAQAYELTVSYGLLVSSHAPGKAGELKYGREDILLEGRLQEWSMYFDGSAMGQKKQMADFEVVWWTDPYYGYGEKMHNNVLMTFIGANSLPGLGVVKPQDIVIFKPFLHGGSEWDMFLDGSDLSLTTGAETIDAVAWSDGPEWSDIVFSTTGKATLVSDSGSLTAEDEDLIACGLNSVGDNTDGWCYLYFDGSAAGLPASADIAAAWIDNGSDDLRMFLTFTAPVTIGGVKYQANDLVVCHPLDGLWGTITECDWEGWWKGNLFGLKGKKIDGLDIPDAWPRISDIYP